MAVMGAGWAAAQDQTAPKPVTKTTPTAKKKTAAKTTAKPTIPLAQPLTIPADATPNADGTYSYKDKAGKNWTYSKTPFGISKIEQQAPGSGASMKPAAAPQTVTSIDNGDTVKFSKQTPFGTSVWEKKKSELSDEEKTIFKSQHPDNNQ